MLQKRIFIVDGSVVIRRSLARGLTAEPRLTVAGSASSGRTALMKMPLLRPDLVLLGFDMPGSEGLDTLLALRTVYPTIPVLLLNSPSVRRGAAAIDALSLGAAGSAVKPAPGDRSAARLQIFGAEVASLVAAWPFTGSDELAARQLGGAGILAARVDVVAIGVSTGGPAALMELLPALPADFPVPIVIVQHMPPVFTRLLAERLDARCRIKVSEGRSRQALLPGEAWIAPGDFHMTVERDGAEVVMNVGQGPRENSCRPSVDVLFRSIAQTFGDRALAVVMTGMGRDGVAGCQTIRAARGHTIVQDEASSVVWGMPGLVVKADLADQIVPLYGLAEVITGRVAHLGSGRGDLVGP
jgi:two-component system chemotaxis response regulator CheB